MMQTSDMISLMKINTHNIMLIIHLILNKDMNQNYLWEYEVIFGTFIKKAKVIDVAKTP